MKQQQLDAASGDMENLGFGASLPQEPKKMKSFFTNATPVPYAQLYESRKCL